MSRKPKTLSEKLAELANPTPKFADPEDDLHHETQARLDEYEEEEQISSKKALPQKRNLRQVNAEALGDVSKRYLGKRVSRKSLRDSDEDTEDEDEEDDEGEEEEDDEEEIEEEEDMDDDLASFRSKLKMKTKAENGEDSFEGTDEEEKDGDEGEEEEDDDDMEEGEEEEEYDMDEDLDMDDEEGIQKFSRKSEESELSKGKVVKEQLALWDQLLECRIKLQKGLTLSNQLPQGPENFKLFTEAAGTGFATAKNETEKAVKTLVESLLELQTQLLKRNSNTKSILKRKAEKVEESDEEIPSDTEESEAEENDKEEEPENKRTKLGDYDKEIAERHDKLKPFRNQTLQMWNEKTRLATGRAFGKSKSGFSGFEQSVLKQIEHILADRQRLIKRTRTKRSAYKILGKFNEESKDEPVKKDVLEDENVVEENTRTREDDQEDAEIFDDDDFYHQLLRELIERRTADGGSDQIALGRQWLEIQKLRSKAKRNVDPKASKGRRLRFGIHSKLVSFMAPFPATSWSDVAKNELFSSLFGSGAAK